MQIAGLGSGQAATAGVARRDDAPTSHDQAPTAAPTIKFPSPTLKYDPQSRLVIFQVLNPETGDVVRQYPSQKVVKLYQDRSGSGSSASAGELIPGLDPNAAEPSSPHAQAGAAVAGKAPAAPSSGSAAATGGSSETAPSEAGDRGAPSGQAAAPTLKVIV